MDVLGIGVVLVVIFNLLFAGMALIHGKRRPIEIFYVLVTVFASLWSIAVLILSSPGTPLRLFVPALYLHYIAGDLAYLSVFWFSIFYPERRPSLAFPIALTAVNLAVQVLVLVPGFLFHLLPGGLTLADRITFNPLGYGIFVVLLSLIYILDEFNLASGYRCSSGSEKKSLGYLIVGSSFAGFFGILFNLILPWFGNFSLFIAGPYFVTAAFLGVSVFNVFKFRFLNLRVIAAEAFVVILVLTLVVRLISDLGKPAVVIDGVLVFLALIFGYFLIRSVIREVWQREEITKLATDLAAANEELKRLDQAKSEFISIASHQLRAPLTIIKGYVSMLLEGTLGQVPALVRESMGKVAISTEQLVHLIADLLDLSRIEGGRMKYDFDRVTMDGIVAEVVRELEGAARAKGLTLAFDGARARGLAVKADPGKLREVVINLVDNAVKYTAQGGVAVALYPETRDDRAWLMLVVRDSGIGVKRADTSRMFSKFMRTEEAKRIRPDGLGLGLYVVKKIVEDHGGRVWMESPGLGQGSVFYVSLPVVA